MLQKSFDLLQAMSFDEDGSDTVFWSRITSLESLELPVSCSAAAMIFEKISTAMLVAPSEEMSTSSEGGLAEYTPQVENSLRPSEAKRSEARQGEHELNWISCVCILCCLCAAHLQGQSSEVERIRAFRRRFRDLISLNIVATTELGHSKKPTTAELLTIIAPPVIFVTCSEAVCCSVCCFIWFKDEQIESAVVSPNAPQKNRRVIDAEEELFSSRTFFKACPMSCFIETFDIIRGRWVTG